MHEALTAISGPLLEIFKSFPLRKISFQLSKFFNCLRQKRRAEDIEGASRSEGACNQEPSQVNLDRLQAPPAPKRPETPVTEISVFLCDPKLLPDDIEHRMKVNGSSRKCHLNPNLRWFDGDQMEVDDVTQEIESDTMGYSAEFEGIIAYRVVRSSTDRPGGTRVKTETLGQVVEVFYHRKVHETILDSLRRTPIPLTVSDAEWKGEM
ncbi:uncharacterized protein FFFS_15756 [Fusarium fujikuroi]|nr:uncharacterized protein FFFS_15756 [Fusarium fujikuroi]